MARDFRQLLEGKWDEQKFLCVGLDSDVEKIPEAARRSGVRETIVNFNRVIIDATKDLVCAYKPNSAFYEAHGDEGWSALRETVHYIHEVAPDVPVIVDAKRADIGSTNEAYADAIFDWFGSDAVTVHPYLGREALAPLLARKEKGVIVLCRTSNPGAGEFQDLKIDGEPLYHVVAKHVAETWDVHGNCGLVVGATYCEELAQVRAIAPEMPILIPGIGMQNGDLAACVKNGKTASGKGIILGASRSIIFASSGADFAEAARREAQKIHSEIQAALLQ